MFHGSHVVPRVFRQIVKLATFCRVLAPAWEVLQNRLALIEHVYVGGEVVDFLENISTGFVFLTCPSAITIAHCDFIEAIEDVKFCEAESGESVYAVSMGKVKQ